MRYSSGQCSYQATKREQYLIAVSKFFIFLCIQTRHCPGARALVLHGWDFLEEHRPVESSGAIPRENEKQESRPQDKE